MLGEDAVGAIFDHRKKRAKRDKEVDGGTNGQPKKRKKKEKRRHNDMLVAATGQKGRKLSTKDVADHFETILKAPCPNHTCYPVHHSYKDCGLLKRHCLGGAMSPRGG